MVYADELRGCAPSVCFGRMQAVGVASWATQKFSLFLYKGRGFFQICVFQIIVRFWFWP